MRKVKLTVLVLIQLTMAQSQVNTRGTIIFGGITSEGIFVFADSRSSFMRGDKIVAYYEGCQKIQPVENYVVAMSGLQSYGNIAFPGLLDYFLSMNEGVNMKSFHAEFIRFSVNMLRPQYIEEFKNNHFVVAGFVEGKPEVRYYTGEEEIVLSSPGEMVSNKFSPFKLYDSVFIRYLESDYVKYATNMIGIFSGDHLDSFGGIGGNPSVVSVKDGEIKWVRKNEFNFIKQRNIDDKLRDGTMPMKYFKLPEDSVWLKGEFDKFFRPTSRQ